MTGARVLIVEDESVIALDIQRRLSRIGYDVVGHASTGEEALRMALALQPDAILMDVQLRGEMDGIETAERIRQHQDIPVIYLTAYANDQTLERAKSTEPYGYLTKPFEERELYTTVEIALYKHRSMERTIRKQAQQLQLVMQSIPEGIMLLDANRHILLANSAANQHLNRLSEVSPGNILEKLGRYSIDDLILSSQTALWHDIECETDVGRHDYEVSVRPAIESDDCGEKVDAGWVVVTRDVTDLHEIRRQAQKQEQLAAVGQLAAGIAHDFNNVLAGIKIAVEMIRMTEPDLLPANRQRLELVVQQSQHASGLIKQIMDFSRRSVSECKSVSLVLLLHEFRDVLRLTFPETIAIEFDYDSDDYMLDLDPNQMMQVLMNLSLNARDAMPQGGTLTFTLRKCEFDMVTPPAPELADGHWISLRVSDTGTGIKDDVLPHIFEPFFSTKGPERGTGLGLAQAYGIVRKHNGFIDVTSREGHGTQFTIYLPAAATTPVSQRDSEPAPEAIPNGLGQMILFVEDNDMLRTAMAEALTMLQYRVIVAREGEEALKLLEFHHGEVRLVISDLTMPKMGGVGLAHEIRVRYPELQVVMMTGYSSEKDVLALKGEGVTQWLQKPVDLETLVQTIEKLLRPTPAF